MAYDRPFNIRLSEKQLTEIKGAAQFRQQTVSVFVRDAIKKSIDEARSEFRKQEYWRQHGTTES
jgi:uncharacterized protein (DUF1778 family)